MGVGTKFSGVELEKVMSDIGCGRADLAHATSTGPITPETSLGESPYAGLREDSTFGRRVV